MAQTYSDPSDIMEFTAPSGGALVGTPYLIGQLLAIAKTSAAVGLPFRATTEGVHLLPKTTGEAWTEGAFLYWDDSGKKITTTSASNTLVGSVGIAASSGATSGYCRLNGAVSPSAGTPTPIQATTVTVGNVTMDATRGRVILGVSDHITVANALMTPDSVVVCRLGLQTDSGTKPDTLYIVGVLAYAGHLLVNMSENCLSPTYLYFRIIDP